MNSRKSAMCSGRRRGFQGMLLVALLLALVHAGCPDQTPPAAVTEFATDPGDGQIVLTWRNPDDGDFAAVRVQRDTGGHPSTPAEGQTAYDGPAEQATDTGLANGTVYYYTIFARDGNGNYSTGVTAVGVPVSPNAAPEVLETFDYVGDVLDELPDGALTPAEREQFSGLLTGADLAYRGGDPCEAAGLLEACMTLSQGVRDGSRENDTRDAAEVIYNTGRQIRYQILSGPTPGPCPGSDRVGLESDVALDEAAADNTQADTEITFGEPEFHTVWTGGELHTKLKVPGADSQVEEGAPEVPMTRRLLAIPKGATIEVSHEVIESETIKMRLHPAQNPKVLPLDDEKAYNTALSFVKNTAVYAKDAPYPASPVRVIELGSYRDLRIAVLEVAGGQYNPVQETMTLFSKVDAHVDFVGGEGGFVTERANGPFESKSGIREAVLNKLAAAEFVLPDLTLAPWVGEEYLILTHPDFRPAADTLATWKNQAGIMTRVFEVGAGTDRQTTTQIENLIDQHYQNGLVRPSYILLLGDVEFIPTFHPERALPIDPGTVEYIATDMPYANVTTPDSGPDIIPEMAIARIPVDTVNEAQTVVNKIIDYESAPPDDSHFYNNAMIAGHFQCCQKDVGWIDRGANQMWFLRPAEFAYSAITRAGYGVERVYTETVDQGDANATPPSLPYTGDTTPRKYWDLGSLPADIGPDSTFNWNQTGAEVVAAWNAGCFLIIHSDHGWEEGWGAPWFNTGHVGQLNNAGMLPFVFSMNCMSGYFDNEDDQPAVPTTKQYFVDRLLRKQNGGAVAVIAAARVTGSYENGVLLMGLVDSVFPYALHFGGTGHVRRLGDILNHGRLYLMSRIGSHPWINDGSVADETQLYNAFGDPTTAMWVDSPLGIVLPPPEEIYVEERHFGLPYPIDETVFTAYQILPDAGLTPIGRGTVEGGEAIVELIGGYSSAQPVMLAATHPSALPASFQFNAATGKVLTAGER